MRRPTRKEDFLAAIKYEVNLDLLRKKRKKVRIFVLLCSYLHDFHHLLFM